MRNCFLVVAVLALAPCAYAQRSGPGSNPQVALQPFTRVNIIESETVKGAPYSAEVVNESVQVLPDGNRIVHRSTSRVYRDSEGRTRRESDTPSGVVEINISDPMLGKSWGLNPDRRIAIERPRPAMLNGNVNLNGQLEHLTVMLNGQIASFVARGGNGYSFATGQNSETSAEEKLTPKIIEGVRVEGLRRTTTIPAGAIGNERAIVVTSDQWTSPDLKVLVLSESSDPRTGTSTYKLVNVKRGDAPASLFQVPADYTVQTGPLVGRGGRQ